MNEPKTLYDWTCKCWRDGRDIFKRYRKGIDELEAAILQTAERRVVEFPEAPAGLLTTLFVAVGHFEAVAIRADLIRMWIEEEYRDWFHEKIEKDALRFLDYPRTSLGKRPNFGALASSLSLLATGKSKRRLFKKIQVGRENKKKAKNDRRRT